MTGKWTEPTVAHAVVEGEVRRQLRNAFDRGLHGGAHGAGGLADPHAPEAFSAIIRAVDDYAASVAQYRLSASDTAEVADPS